MLAEAVRRLQYMLNTGSARSIAEMRGQIEDIWNERSRWILLHVGPETFQQLAADMVKTSDSARLNDLLRELDGITQIFWDEHEAVILVPLVRIVKHWMTGAPSVSERLSNVVMP